MIKVLVERNVDVVSSKELIDFIDNIVRNIVDANEDGNITTREILGIIIENSLEGFRIGNNINAVIEEVRDLVWEEIVELVEHSVSKFDGSLDVDQKEYIARVIATISEIRLLVIDFDETW